jgi:hypothetical protein
MLLPAMRSCNGAFVPLVFWQASDEIRTGRDTVEEERSSKVVKRPARPRRWLETRSSRHNLEFQLSMRFPPSLPGNGPSTLNFC